MKTIVDIDFLLKLKKTKDEFLAGKYRYILLSAMDDVIKDGKSLPCLIRNDDASLNMIVVFKNKEEAKKYCRKNKLRLPDGGCPIGLLPQSKRELAHMLLSCIFYGTDVVAMAEDGNLFVHDALRITQLLEVPLRACMFREPVDAIEMLQE